MKAIVKIVLIGSILIPSFTYANVSEKKDTTEATACLKVTGKAVDENYQAIDGVEVRLFKHDDMIEQKDLTNVGHHDHNFIFILESNEYYTIKISKPGFVERWVGIYTTLPSGVKIESLFYYEFDVVLFREKKMDDYYLDFPIALIRYWEKSGSFDCNTAYTDFITAKIEEAECFADFSSK